ncbi:TolC family protein [Thermocrinis albus]|nr:TolC family protein [Thermocrinis albus]
MEGFSILRKRNHDVQISLLEVEKAKGSLLQAKLLPNPTLSVSYTGTEISGGRIRDNSNTLFSVRLDQQIELGGKRHYRVLAEDMGVKAQQYASLQTLRDAYLNYVQAFFKTLSDREYLLYLREDLGSYDKILSLQEEKWNKGVISLIDLMKLKAYRVDLQNAILQAEANYKSDLYQLSFLLNMDNIEPLKENMGEPEASLEELLKRAVAQDPQIRQLESLARSWDYRIKLLQAYRIPDIDVGVEYDSFGVKYRPGLGVGVAITLPIFDRRQGDLLSAFSTRQQILLQLEKAKRQVETQVRQAYLQYFASRQSYLNMKNLKGQMDELLERTKRAYLLGGLSVLDFLDTLRTYRAFMYNFLSSYYGYLQAYYSLLVTAWALP